MVRAWARKGLGPRDPDASQAGRLRAEGPRAPWRRSPMAPLQQNEESASPLTCAAHLSDPSEGRSRCSDTRWLLCLVDHKEVRHEGKTHRLTMRLVASSSSTPGGLWSRRAERGCIPIRGSPAKHAALPEFPHTPKRTPAPLHGLRSIAFNPSNLRLGSWRRV
jgi:hypothetical protein